MGHVWDLDGLMGGGGLGSVQVLGALSKLGARRHALGLNCVCSRSVGS